jgi:choline dehydrogenase
VLQLSGVGPRQPLEDAGIDVVHESPGVGANLLDHLANGLLVRTRGTETLASAESLRNLARWALLGRGPLTSNLGEAVAFVRSRPGLVLPDLELLLAPVLFEKEGLEPPSEHGLTLAVVLLVPRSRGTVLLRSADPREPPAIDPRYLTDPDAEDEATLLRGLRLARRVLAQEPLASFVDGEILPGDDARTDDQLRAHLRALSQTLYHPAGTCRMGSDAGAVVDTRLRVRGIGGLRVADASVMPALPRGHTNWPTVMIAERASDFVAADL